MRRSTVANLLRIGALGTWLLKWVILSRSQLKSIISQQTNDYLFLGESLLELGHVTEDILERELTIFKEEQARYILDDVVVPEGIFCPEVIATCVGMTKKMFLRVANLVVKLGEGFLSEECAATDYHLTISVPLQVNKKIRFLLSVSSEVAVVIASQILGEDATRESEALLEDAVGEFCNYICGNVVAKLAQLGIVVEVGPPESHAAIPEPTDGRVVVCYPANVTNGDVDLRFLTYYTAPQ